MGKFEYIKFIEVGIGIRMHVDESLNEKKFFVFLDQIFNEASNYILSTSGDKIFQSPT